MFVKKIEYKSEIVDCKTKDKNIKPININKIKDYK